MTNDLFGYPLRRFPWTPASFRQPSGAVALLDWLETSSAHIFKVDVPGISSYSFFTIFFYCSFPLNAGLKCFLFEFFSFSWILDLFSLVGVIIRNVFFFFLDSMWIQATSLTSSSFGKCFLCWMIELVVPYKIWWKLRNIRRNLGWVFDRIGNQLSSYVFCLLGGLNVKYGMEFVAIETWMNDKFL